MEKNYSTHLGGGVEENNTSYMRNNYIGLIIDCSIYQHLDDIYYNQRQRPIFLMVTHASTDFELKTSPCIILLEKGSAIRGKAYWHDYEEDNRKRLPKYMCIFFLAKKEVPLGFVWEPIPLPYFLPRSRFENEA